MPKKSFDKIGLTLASHDCTTVMYQYRLCDTKTFFTVLFLIITNDISRFKIIKIVTNNKINKHENDWYTNELAKMKDYYSFIH